MKSIFLTLAALAFIASPMAAQAAPKIGEAAPEFTGMDSNGNVHKLSDFKGKTVVLEWTNPQCPYVVKHYDSGNMQKLQAEYAAKDIVWLSINSSAAGKEGNQSSEEANTYMEDKKSGPTARILDPTGVIGKAYEAKVTPHMYVINKEGVLVYEGAIDDNDSSKQEDIATSKNYVKAALDALAEGKPIEIAQTKAYGCGVKYE